VDAELRQQPPADEGAYDSDDKVADDPIPGASHDLARQPSSDKADHDDDEKTFIRHDTLALNSAAWTVADFIGAILQAPGVVTVASESTQGRYSGEVRQASALVTPSSAARARKERRRPNASTTFKTELPH
jgi:hypothetical protein